MKLKSLICLLLALLLGSVALAETTMYDVIDDYEGVWGYERVTVRIECLDDVVYATVYWPNSAAEVAQWEYELNYDGVSDSFISEETGVLTYVTYGEDGEIASSEVQYSDGAASFKLNEEGKLVWTNFKETPGENEIVLERTAFINVLGDYLDEDDENAMSSYSSERYVYAFMQDGVPIRVTARMTEEVYDQIANLEFDENYDQNLHDLIAGLPVVSVENLSDQMLPQETLDSFVGMKGSDLLAQGFEANGYGYSDEETILYMQNGLFDYAAEFEEIIGDDVDDPYEAMNDMTVKAVRVEGMSFDVVSTDGDASIDFDGILNWLFGGLYSSMPQPAASPEWVKALPQAQDENTQQLFVVAGMGMENTTATISMHKRDENGEWMQILSTPGFVGKNGLCLDEDHAEGCAQTPIGVYHFNKAFGIAADPGCAIPYTQVDENTYWSGDPDRQYNQMVDINDVPDLVMDDSEHIVDYDYQYQYCLNISFNEEGTPGRGSAIFLHCFGPLKPYTGGCVAIPENIMKLVMQTVTEDCVVVIDTLENLGGSF